MFLFLTVLGLRRCARLSLVVARGVTLRCGALASHCSGFSCCGAAALRRAAFSSCGLRALEHSLSSCGARAQ